MDSDDTGASSPCFAHELEQSADGSFHAVDPQQRRDVMRWRKSERQRQIDARLAIPASRRAEMAAQIARRVLPLLEPLKDRVVSFYWPLRGEPDLRALMREVIAAGGACALPVVVQKNAPLAFHAYAPGDRLEKGFWNIPVPARVRAVVPDVVFAPVVGFDPGCYRLGYGGGYFDRTLAALDPAPLAIGVGYSSAALPTIFPQPHDIPLGVVVTEEAVHRPG